MTMFDMTPRTAINCITILVGAVVMLFTLIKSGALMEVVPFVREKWRRRITVLLKLHRGLMSFFLVGYLIVMVGFSAGATLISEAFVAAIFLLTAVFVYVGMVIQARLLSEIQLTMRGLLPICSRCKKIREPKGNSKDPKAWIPIESYISHRSDVAFTHGYCPQCHAELLEEINAGQNAA